MPWPRLERRAEPSRLMLVFAPILAIGLTILAGALIFSAMGYNGVAAIRQIFVVPLHPERWPDLLVKAGPLILIATGLSIGFRANVWNIGAEGQYVVGAIAGTGVAGRGEMGVGVPGGVPPASGVAGVPQDTSKASAASRMHRTMATPRVSRMRGPMME